MRQTFPAEISGFLLAVLLIVRISLLGEAAKAASPELGSKAGGRGKQLAEELASRSLSGDFESSLLTRESIDFFLTPVYSVRESLAQASHASNTNKEAPIVVQFDATFELNQPIERLHNFAFARYWVSSELYRLEIIWSEPGAQDLRSHLIPPGLSIQSASGKFWVSNDLMPRFNGSYSMPTEKRPMPFTYRYGDFPISNLRYTDQESSDELAVLAKLRASDALVGSSITNLLASSSDGKIAVKKTRFEPQNEKGSRSETFEIADQTGHLLKRLEYKYSGSSNQLQELSTYTPEQKIIVGFKGEGATVRLNKTNVYQIRQFPLVYGEGGRICITKYKAVSTGIQGPDRIEIYDGKTNTIFHSVQLSNVRLAGSTPEKVNQDAEQFKNLGGVLKPYYDIISKSSKTNASSAGIDAPTVRKLKARCDQFLQENTATMGERLAAANLSMDLNMLIGDDTNALKAAKTYLLMLSTNRMPFALLATGTSMIENAAKARRPAQESELLSYWLDMLPQEIDPESALHFSFFALSKNNCVVAMKLLEKFEPQFNTPDEHLERAAIYHLAARFLLRDPKLAPNADKNELEHVANESLKEFTSLVEKHSSLNSFQETLKKRVDASAKTQQSPPSATKN